MKNRGFDITGKVVVVTGGCGVLAGCTAEYLHEQGAQVVILDRDRDKIAAQPLPGYYCDVLDRKVLEGVREQILARFGRIDVLLNGAGGNIPGATVGPEQSVFALNLEDYDKVLALNLKGTVLPTLVFAEAMVREKQGCVVNFSSMSAQQALTRVLGYGNAKAAIDNFTKWMAVELATKYGDGLRVNAVAPGFFIGNQNRALLIQEDGRYTPRGEQVIAKTPMRRFGSFDEVAGTIHYLISDAARFVTGAVVPVDGGFSAFTGV